MLKIKGFTLKQALDAKRLLGVNFQKLLVFLLSILVYFVYNWLKAYFVSI
jgi:NADH:ubiquinone oxidoreductase subunit 3 (subunit A)